MQARCSSGRKMDGANSRVRETMGAENQVTVQLQTLDDVVAKLGVFGSDITAHLDELEQRVARLHVQWSGVSATAHRKAHEEWSEGARQMADGVQRMQRAAAAAHAAFADAARQNRSMFS